MKYIREQENLRTYSFCRSLRRKYPDICLRNGNQKFHNEYEHVWDQDNQLEFVSPSSTFPDIQEGLCREIHMRVPMQSMLREVVVVSQRGFLLAEKFGLPVISRVV